MSSESRRFGLFAAVVIALSMALPYSVLAYSPGPNAAQVSLNGTLHFIYGTQTCVAQQGGCTSGASLIPYLTIGGGENYILVGADVSMFPDGQRMLVTGWLTAASGTAPSLAFSADLVVTNIHAHCHMHSSG